VNQLTLAQLWTKLLLHLEAGDLLDFLNKEISRSKILDMLCNMRSFENIDKGNVEAWQKRDACEVGFQHDRQTDIINAGTKQKNEEEGWESESEIHTLSLTRSPECSTRQQKN
jgi:hypothetical protein